MITMLKVLSLIVVTLLLVTGCASFGGGQASAEQAETARRYVDIGYRHLEFDNTQPARRAFREAMELDPRGSGAYLGMALVYQSEGEPELAEDYFQQAMSMNDDTQYVHLYGQFLFRQGRLEESKEYVTLATQDPDYSQRGASFEDLAIINLYEGDLESAKTHFDRAIQLNRMLPMPYWHMTNIHMRQGNTEQAMEYYEGFENLVSAEVMDHTEDSLILGLRVTQAVEREETYSGLLELLEEQYPESQYLQELDQ